MGCGSLHSSSAADPWWPGAYSSHSGAVQDQLRNESGRIKLWLVFSAILGKGTVATWSVL